MKTLYIYLTFIVLALVNTSCLKAGLDDLETYDLNDITNVRFEYRWWDESNKQMRVMEMTVQNNIDATAKEVVCTITVPEATDVFTEDIRNQVSLSTLAINVDASTAARITPVGNAPVMGEFPSDFSAKEYTYTVTAGSGAQADWTIRIDGFNK